MDETTILNIVRNIIHETGSTAEGLIRVRQVFNCDNKTAYKLIMLILFEKVLIEKLTKNNKSNEYQERDNQKNGGVRLFCRYACYIFSTRILQGSSF